MYALRTPPQLHYPNIHSLTTFLPLLLPIALPTIIPFPRNFEDAGLHVSHISFALLLAIATLSCM